MNSYFEATLQNRHAPHGQILFISYNPSILYTAFTDPTLCPKVQIIQR